MHPVVPTTTVPLHFRTVPVHSSCRVAFPAAVPLYSSLSRELKCQGNAAEDTNADVFEDCRMPQYELWRDEVYWKDEHISTWKD